MESKWIKANPQKVHCTLKIQKVQNVEIAVEILDGAGLTAEQYEVTYYDQETGEPIREKIEISGSETQLAVAQSAGILRDNKLFFEPTIDLALMAGTKTVEGLEIVISSLDLTQLLTPYELINHSQINLVKVVVRIKGWTTETYRITEFEAINIPEGLQADIKTKYLDVTMRGKDFQIPWIEAKDLTVQVDFANATAGDGKYTATVIFTRYNQSFVVGNYTVNATVTQVEG